jgi:hypothetical protein
MKKIVKNGGTKNNSGKNSKKIGVKIVNEPLYCCDNQAISPKNNAKAK